MQTTGEDKALMQVLDRMAAAFPTVRRDHVVSVVAQAHRAFTGRPVRDYVPLLVERQVRARLRSETRPDAA
jgi:hypothetical protein